MAEGDERGGDQGVPVARLAGDEQGFIVRPVRFGVFDDGDERRAPGRSATDEGDGGAPPGLQRAFWTTVAAFNVALFATSLGAMLVVFRGRWTGGGVLLAAGVVVGLIGLRRYRRARRRLDEEGAAAFDDEGGDADEGEDAGDRSRSAEGETKG